MIDTDKNHTSHAYPREKTIYSFFEEMTVITPNKVAVEFEDRHITYHELNYSADQLAAILIYSGISVGDVVAISTERSINMIVAILAILKAGAAYLPIEVNTPDERKRYYLETANAKSILSTLDDKILFGISNINIEKIPDDISPSSNPQVSSDALAYVIFTSGSTGKPKGVMIKHHSVVNRLLWMKEQYGLSETDVFLQKTLYSFDVSVWEIFLWFFCGAKLCLLKSGNEGNFTNLTNAINKHGVTACHFVPSILRTFLRFLSHYGGIEKLKCLKRVFASGEALSYDLVDKFNSVLTKENDTQLHNLYGPTEATVDVTYFDCTNYHAEDRIVPIGKPIWNTKIYILDENGKECADGESGEIYISGDGVAIGYINHLELTEKSFVPDIFCHGATMYRTGDLGRWRNGVVEFLGRKDNQVKIHGIRVELEEIENQLLGYEPIKQSVVIAIGNTDKKLIAYYNGDNVIELSHIIDYLSKKLPKAMIPSEFIFIDNIPVSQNGKINRKELALLYNEKDRGMI
ncbi:MAG: amino acid adenylation domain-containing protein [Bacteroidales bacterium]|jgi:amino acid adenylation domain-containing protein|nr:amino acid adenylation domain-containing protein [Bacteroidales bacterium]